MANTDGAERVLNTLRDYFAPEAVDSAHQKVVRFLQFRCTDQAMGEYFAEFDLLGRRTDSKMHIGLKGRLIGPCPLPFSRRR